MATTIWPTAMSADVLASGRPCAEVTDSWMEFMWKRNVVVEQSGGTFQVGAITLVTDTSYTTVASQTIWLPEHMTNTRSCVIRVTLRALCVSGATCSMQIQDNVSATNGTEDSTTSTGDYLESLITIPNDSWAGTERLIDVNLKRTGGTSVGINSTNMLFNLRFGDI